MSQNLLLKCLGLHTFTNLLGDVKSGSLTQADNIVINRNGIIEPCRGFSVYGDSMSSVSKQLTTYKNRIIRHFGTTLQYDNGSGTFTSFSGTYTETETGLRIKSTEANGNLYFTTSTGMQKMSAASASTIASTSITNAGGIKALDVALSLNSTTGFLTQEGIIAYRVIWGIKDSNNNLIFGSPSQREVIDNPLIDPLVTNYNSLLTALDVASAVSGADTLSDVNYNSILAVGVGASATTIQTSMSALCIKLDADMGGTNFTAASGIKDIIDALTFSNPPTSAQLLSLQVQYDKIVSTLNSLIGTASINTSVVSFIVSTQSSTVNLNITIPSGVTTSYFYQVYRTAVVESTGVTSLSDIDPGDEQGLVYEANPTSTDLSNGYITYHDIVPDAFRGTNLYTNPNSGEGILQSNEIPPKAKDITLFKNHLFYANTETRYRKNISMLSVSSLVANTSTIVFTDGTTTKTYTFSTTEDVATRKVLISSLSTPAQQVDQSARSLVHVINRDTTGLVYAYYLSGPTDVPGLILFESRALGTNPFYIVTNSTATGSQFSPDLKPLNAITNISVANPTVVTSATHGLVTGNQIIVTSSNSTPSINGLQTVTVVNANTFTVPVNVSILGNAGSFSKLTSAVVSDNEVSPNRIYYSKKDQPEAVPLLNYFDVGPKDKRIIRIVALRESLFIFKQGAIYRLSGDTAPFIVNLFDSSTIITAADTADVLNNEIFLLADQGIVKVSDTGVSIISRPIEDQITKLNIPSFTNYSTVSFGKAYESDRTYYLWTVTNTTDTVATQCFKYNTLTNAWYRSPTSKTCAIVNQSDGKMYLGAADINYIEKERKNFNRTDFADREYSATLASSSSSVSSTEITMPSVTNVNTRDVILQTQYLTISKFNRLLLKLDGDIGVTDTNYHSTLVAVAGDDLRDKLDDLATKLDADTGVNLTNYLSAISGYTSSFSDTQSAFNVIIAKLNLDTGVVSANYSTSSGTVDFEVIITDVNKVNSVVTTEYAFPFIAGPVTTFAHIESVFKWAPQTFGDPSVLKQISESTLLFDATSFSEIELSFASDLQPSFEPLTFEGSGNGIYGSQVYGETNYGGSGNSAPFRVLVPRNKQRCRYMICKVTHSTARENFAIYGLSLTGNVSSTRAYK